MRLFLAGAVLLVYGGCTQPISNEQDAESTPAAELAEQFVDLFVGNAKLEADTESLNDEQRRVNRLNKSTSIHLFDGENGFSRLEEDAQTALAGLMIKSASQYVTAGEDAADQDSPESVPAKLEELTEKWTSIRATLGKRKQLLFQTRASTRVQGQLATLLSMDNSWFWVFFAISIGSLVMVVLHERRHAMRRSLNGGTSQALGLSKILSALLILLVLLLLSFAVFGDALYEFLELGSGEEAPRSQAEEELEKLKVDSEKLNEELEAERRSFEPVAQTFTDRLRRELKIDSELAEQWTVLRQSIRAIDVSLIVQSKVAEALNADLAALEIIQQALDSETEKAIHFARSRRRIRFGLGLFLLSITIGVGWVFQRGVRKRQKKIADTCPVCMNPSFEGVPLRGAGASDLKCEEILEDLGECDFQNKDSFRKLPKLCFATLGHPASGKTFWLAECYRQLKFGQDVPDGVHYEKVTSPGSEKLDEILYYIHEERADPGATDPGSMPRPVLFNFRDRDPWGYSHQLLTIFDFSGEITRDESLSSPQRQRALKADGFFYFLDPTLKAVAQQDSLEEFREDMKELMHLRAGDQIRIPLALCLSKIDLLGSMPYGDPKGAVGDFYESLKNIGRDVGMRQIKQRSDLVKSILPYIFDDWDIEKEIKKLFGGRIMFFPMTPIGLGTPFENPLDSIEDRDIAPYLTLEPMLWLIHMTGHLVLDDMSLASRIVSKLHRG
jgi:hypothetical protein